MSQNGKKTTAPGEKRRLRQFVVCLLLFGLILAGRGLDLAPVERAAAAVSRIVDRDTDLRAVFAQMGASFSRGEPAEETFRVLWEGLLSRRLGPDRGESICRRLTLALGGGLGLLGVWAFFHGGSLTLPLCAGWLTASRVRKDLT